MSEAAIQKRVMMEATRLGLRVFRNNTGCLLNKHGTPVHYGLHVGSSDLIGWTCTGQFVAIETKAKGKMSTASVAQRNFIAEVSKAGGFACIIDDENNLKYLLDTYYNRDNV